MATKNNFVRLAIAVVAALCVANCGKKSKNNNSTAAAPAAGYVTCPANGMILNNGINQPCQPGSTVYVNNGTNGTGYTICPQNGMVMVNGMNQYCTPGQQVYTGGGINNGGINGGCNTGQQYSCSMYGSGWQLTCYNGQMQCVRYY